MKPFDRFPHDGVMRDLTRLKKTLEQLGGYKFGSSGEGEITARGYLVTAYARKYKKKDGWRLVIWKGGKVVQTTFPDERESVVHIISDLNS